jgi:hypothetical protein
MRAANKGGWVSVAGTWLVTALGTLLLAAV